MAQTLYVKDRNEQGKEYLRPVKIIRAWQDADGRQVFLHASGVYGYKDGSPVRGPEEFNIITAPIQKKLAMNWWNQIGERMSREHYEAKAQDEQERLSQGMVEPVEGDNSELDMVLYRRRPIKGKRVFDDPKTWYGYFKERPDWWGHAGVIEIAGYRYEKTELDDENTPEAETPEADEAVNF